MAPEGVSLHTSRVFFADLATFADPPGPDNATELLARLPLQAIIYAWTVGSYLLGTTGEEELVSRVEQHSNGIPVLMSAPAATAGFRTLEAERIALIHAPFRVAGAEVSVDDYGQLFKLPCRQSEIRSIPT
jgi:maleate cis-trans isomerase